MCYGVLAYGYCYGEQFHSVTAVNKKAGYSAPLHAVYNYYVGDSGDVSGWW